MNETNVLKYKNNLYINIKLDNTIKNDDVFIVPNKNEMKRFKSIYRK